MIRRSSYGRAWLLKLLPLACILPTARADAQAPAFITAWGSFGAAPGQFDAPIALAPDAAGNVFVVDQHNLRIQKFTGDGVFISQWGGSGTGHGQFLNPISVAVDVRGDVYVSDSGRCLIQKFSNTGDYIAEWGSRGPGNDQFHGTSWAIGVDRQGDVFVDDYPDSILKFTDAGTYLGRFGGPSVNGIAVTAGGDVYAVPGVTGCVDKYTDGARFPIVPTSCDATVVTGPVRVAVDSFANIYVDEYYAERVVVFNSADIQFVQWGSHGTGYGQFNHPIGIALDNVGNVYVADTSNNRIEKFGQVPTPTISTSWGRLKVVYR